ncbi:MAG: succinyl-diaminopimelate desuccinylase [Aquiluna sp.]|nr:succinyl-diaminopimelate desuccinylase [Aquiluna sp.]
MPTLDITKTLVELTIDICNIESVSSNEKALADEVERVLAGASHLNVVRDGNALVASTSLGRDSRVLIAGHLDTVPVAGNLPAELHHFEREQVIVGRGTVDMKGGIAVMLKLAVEIVEPKFDVTWIFYDNEEVASELNGLGRLAKNYPNLIQGEFAVLCEPTSALVEGGCNGTLRVEVSTKGVKAHSARPWMGQNAIHELLKPLEILNNFQPETVNVDGLDYRESLNAVWVTGGIATNVIPDNAVLTVNYRFAPDKTAAEAIVKIETLFQDFNVKVTDQAEGARPGLDRDAAIQFLAATGAKVGPKYGWTDVARFSAMGVPAVNYGPGDPSLAHADNENVPVGHLFDVEAGLRGWLTL